MALIRLRNNTGWFIPNNLAVHSLAYAILIAVRKCVSSNDKTQALWLTLSTRDTRENKERNKGY